MAKLARWFLVVLFSIGSIGSLVYAQLDNAQNPLTEPKHSGGAHKVAVIGLQDASNENGGQEDALITVIKNVVNWILGILALIALLVLLWGGFQMVTAAGDEEKYKQGFTILKQAAAGLFLIGIAWFVVSIVFWLVHLVANNASPANTES